MKPQLLVAAVAFAAFTSACAGANDQHPFGVEACHLEHGLVRSLAHAHRAESAEQG